MVSSDHGFLRHEMEKFEEMLKNEFSSERGGLAGSAAGRLLRCGGKRLRPALAIAAATAGDFRRDRVFRAALAIELIHTASLVHDDIVDESELRRGQPTVSARHGNHTAVYVGDWLLASAMSELAGLELPPQSSAMLARGVRAMCGGEIEQYNGRFQPAAVSVYLRRAMRKTGMLFAAACAVGAAVSGAERSAVKALTRFGLNFGVAFQIRDDIRDLAPSHQCDGKPPGQDIRDGVASLPLIYAGQSEPGLVEELRQRSEDGDGRAESHGRIIGSVISSGAVGKSADMLSRYAGRCRARLKALPGFECRADLDRLTRWLEQPSGTVN